MIDVFEEEKYKQGIPKCCSRRTYQEHLDMMLCWRLDRAIRNNEKMDCSGCDLKAK